MQESWGMMAKKVRMWNLLSAEVVGKPHGLTRQEMSQIENGTRNCSSEAFRMFLITIKEIKGEKFENPYDWTRPDKKQFDLKYSLDEVMDVVKRVAKGEK